MKLSIFVNLRKDFWENGVYGEKDLGNLFFLGKCSMAFGETSFEDTAGSCYLLPYIILLFII